MAPALLVLAAGAAAAVADTIAAAAAAFVVKVGLERPRVRDYPLQGRVAHVRDLEPRRTGRAGVLADLDGERRGDGRQVPDEDGERLAPPEVDLAELRKRPVRCVFFLCSPDLLEG